VSETIPENPGLSGYLIFLLVSGPTTIGSWKLHYYIEEIVIVLEQAKT